MGAFSFGNGVDTFRIPLVKKAFLRAADAAGGLGVGTGQGDAIRNIKGNIYSNAALHSSVNGLFVASGANGQNAGSHNTFTNDVNFDASRVVPTAEENRPVNIARLPIIKAYDIATTPANLEVQELVNQISSIGNLVNAERVNYELCEFYYFRHPTLKAGFQPAQGGLIADAATKYPEAWAYLQTIEGKKLCKTETEWQNMTTATWATLADGTKIGWNGIGGAPFYVVDTGAGTLRLPDLRGMYAEAAGFDGLGIGGVHGDGIRNIVGKNNTGVHGNGGVNIDGAFYRLSITQSAVNNAAPGEYGVLDASRVVPTAAKNQPRAWGALACVYLGAPK